MLDRINSHTRLACLMATPVRQSNSPKIYNNAFVKLGMNYCYLGFDVAPEDLGGAIASIKALDMLGANFSMPHKVNAVQYMDAMSPAAAMIGAVNMVVHKDGRLEGYNTDGVGYVDNLRQHGIDIKGKSMAMVGVGGAGAAIAIQCALDGLAELRLFNKKDAFWAEGEKLAEKIAGNTACKITLQDVDDRQALGSAIAAGDIFTNATNVGMDRLEHLSVIDDPAMLRPELIVTDVIYHPHVTKLLAMAQALGCKTVNGDGMLISQAATNFKLYTGEEFPMEYIRKLMEE